MIGRHPNRVKARTEVKTTSIEYTRPRRPWPARLFNRIAREGRPLASAEQMLASARATTGLTDLGDEWIMAPLRVLIDSINAEANLHPLGRIIQSRRIQALLSAHLRVRARLAARGESCATRIKRIIVIAGLQRTGTTTLQRLIASDRRVRSIRAWEALSPVPVHTNPETDKAIRIRQAKLAERMLSFLSPDFFAVHPVEHHAPEEDVLLLDHCFMSQSWEALLNVPSYSNWLESQDHARAYAYLRDLLGLLLSGGDAQHWVIKTPHHAEYLDLVLKMFPQAIVVLTHRDPLVATPSFMSMVAHGRALSSNVIDPRQIAEHWVAKIERMMRRVLIVRAGADPSRFIDVSYYDLLADPMRELARIYERAGIEFAEQARKSAQKTAETAVQYRYGRHRYDLEGFGLNRESLDARLGFYRQAHQIPYEQESSAAL